jgi:hypothetical protein
MLSGQRSSGKRVRLQDAAIPKTDTGAKKKMNHNVAKAFFFNDLVGIVRGTCRAIVTLQRED